MQGFRYKKPLSFKRLVAGKGLETTDVGYSVSQHIELLIFTHFGEHRFNRQYGCSIWELDFELIISDWKWEEKFKQSLLTAIRLEEPRIYNVDVQVDLSEAARASFGSGVTEVKKRVSIYVKGLIIETGEAYQFSTDLFLGPLSGKENKV